MKLSSQITFRGCCQEAIKFYQQIFNPIKVKVETFEEHKDLFGGILKEEHYNFIYRAEITFKSEDSVSTIIMCDSPSIIFSDYSNNVNLDNIIYEISDSDEEIIKAIYNKLAVGGKTNTPLQSKPPFKLQGSLIDKFGVCWNIFCI